MKRYLFFLLAVAAIIVSVSSCKDDNNLDELRDQELKNLEAYLAANYPNEEPTSSGLYYIKIEDGYGDTTIKAGDEVQIWYTGRTVADTTYIFDTTQDEDGHQFEPLKFVVGTGDMIKGMEEGVTHMVLGEKARLIIPSNLGYGATSSSSGLPRFSTLIFDVEIYKHKRIQTQ